MRLLRFAVPITLLAGLLVACGIPVGGEADLGLNLESQRIRIIRPPGGLTGSELISLATDLEGTAEFTNIAKLGQDRRLDIQSISVPITVDPEVLVENLPADYQLPAAMTLDNFVISFSVTDGTNTESFGSIPVSQELTLDLTGTMTYELDLGSDPLTLQITNAIFQMVAPIIQGDSGTFDLTVGITFTTDADLPEGFEMSFLLTDGMATIRGHGSL